jgi:hypothetical protein
MPPPQDHSLRKTKSARLAAGVPWYTSKWNKEQCWELACHMHPAKEQEVCWLHLIRQTCIGHWLKVDTAHLFFLHTLYYCTCHCQLPPCLIPSPQYSLQFKLHTLLYCIYQCQSPPFFIPCSNTVRGSLICLHICSMFWIFAISLLAEIYRLYACW